MSTAVLSERLAHTRQALRQLVLGSANVPQQCVIGIRDPQSEVSVWLEGAGTPIDVTHNNVMIGANVVVRSDVPANSIAVGIPAVAKPRGPSR